VTSAKDLSGGKIPPNLPHFERKKRAGLKSPIFRLKIPPNLPHFERKKKGGIEISNF